MLSGTEPQYGVPLGAGTDGDDPAEGSDAQMQSPVRAQPTIILPASLPAPIPVGASWNEVQTADGRVYYFNSDTRKSQWVKPSDLALESEDFVGESGWEQVKIWDGRSYFYNPRTSCSVWHVPPEIELSKGQFDPELSALVEYDAIQKTDATVRKEFVDLLREKGITEAHSFTEALPLIMHDRRFTAVNSEKAKQLMFAAYITLVSKERVQEHRDVQRSLFMEAVSEWRNWKEMNESTTFAKMEATFRKREWFATIGTDELRKLFEVFSLEFIEIEKLKKRKLQDALMQDLKNDILSRTNQVDLASSGAVDMLFTIYSTMKPQPQFWTYLSDSQKLVVIKSCISQRIRDLRMAIANKLPLSRERRNLRQEKDRIKRLIGELVRSKTEQKVVKRGQGLVIPVWNTEMEAVLAGEGADLRLAKDLFGEFVEDLKAGADPLAGIV
jgi:hypothetical protein